MKRYITLFCLVVMATMGTWAADSYTSLWQRYNNAVNKSLPRTAIEVLDQIIQQATTNKAYGHLVKAQIARGNQITEISPDSLMPVTTQMEKAYKQAKDPALKAVYATVLGNLYNHSSMFDDQQDAEKKSRDYYAAALKNKDLLAKTQAKTYEPTVEKGYIDKVFNGDLLHVIGCEAKEYAMLNSYYQAHGNRSAACIAACLDLRSTPSSWHGSTKARQAYRHKADSLINIYQDLYECGELAIERYLTLVSPLENNTEEKIRYIDQALAKWGAWPRMNILRNYRTELTQPEFNICVKGRILLPGKERMIQINSVRNIEQLTLNIYRLNKNYYNCTINNNQLSGKTIDKLKQDADKTPVQTITRQYYGHEDYEMLDDSAFIAPLPLGNYLIEAKTDVKGVDPQYAMLAVSDIYFLAQQHLKTNFKQTRIVVVSATTGNPIVGATVNIKESMNDKAATDTIMKTNSKGEVVYQGKKGFYIYANYGNDVYHPYERIWASATYNKRKPTEQINYYTDRSIYRPGQTVQVAVTATYRPSPTEAKVLEGRTITLKLRDTKWKTIKEQQVTTDKYGTAHTQFQLPTSGLTGNYSISSDIPSSSSVSFKVEEYKRPTFQIEWDTIRTQYEAGDTITLTGRAMSYAGAPVQQAKVKATAERRIALWWWRFCRYNDSATQELPEATTDDQGRFSIRLPLTIDEDDYKEKLFYSFYVSATVTDGAGESQTAQTTIPLGTSATVFVCDMDEEIERDNITTINFAYRNSTGQPIDGNVTYTIDGHSYNAKTNQDIDLKPILKGMKSGSHKLTAICGSDTLTHNFVLFSASDTQAPIDTPDWFYLSSNQFTEKSKVRLQLGSSAAEQYVVYSIFADNRTLESGTLPLKGQLYLRDFNYRSEYGEVLTLTYAWVKDGELYSHDEHITCPIPDKQLNTQWTSFRDRLTPGQKETWTLHVSTPDGKPAEAQLTATLYDHSLDALNRHRWTFTNSYTPTPLNYNQWHSTYTELINLYSFQENKLLPEEQLTQPQLTPWEWTQSYGFGPRRYVTVQLGSINTKASIADAETLELNENKVTALNKKTSVKNTASTTKTDTAAETSTDTSTWTAVRENFNETAFFYPTLETNSKGDINISFTLPETVTTWRFMGQLHDRSLNAAQVEALTVAQKKVMVQPNMPRFVRKGDKATIAVRITNTTAQKQSGKLMMNITSATGDNAIINKQQNFEVEANTTTTVTFNFTLDSDEPLLICKTMASGTDWADGEQHYLPLLSNYEQVVNTLPFTLNGTGNHTLNTASLFDNNATRKQTTVEYTDNPAWLMIQALPSLASPSGDNAISLAAAYYANAIARHIIGLSPSITQTIKLWQQQPEESLTGILEKNESLKQTILAETPWLLTAARDTERMRSLASYLDTNQINAAQQSILSRLTDLKASNGLTAWWKGMNGNIYITAAVAETLARLERLTGAQTDAHSILTDAMDAMDKEMTKRVAEMKERSTKSHAIEELSFTELHYLYTSALTGRKQTATINYLLNILEKQKQPSSIREKAFNAVTLALYGRTTKAKEYLQSAREYTVYKEGMGRYYDTPLAGYSWLDYRIPTQVATIEAIKLTDPTDTTTISQMQQWLLQEKRTTAWSTPVNSVNAIYAFLLDNTKVLSTTEAKPVITIDGKQIETNSNTAMIGTQTYQTEGAVATVNINKPLSHTSWGAVYATMLMPIDKIKQTSTGLSIERNVIGTSNNLKVGDRITVRITIIADRDYDFVEVTDKRAACLEPADQLSGYRQGYYACPRDSYTSYFFDKMSKGKHVIETSYYIDRAGDYQSGQCKAVCAYSPSFAGHTAGNILHVNP